jgi:hypothetical protein
MPIAKFVYTPRQRIYQDDIFVEIHENESETLAIDCSVDLTEYSLPQDATVTLEVSYKLESLFVEMGTVGSPVAVESYPLTKFTDAIGLKCRISVTCLDSKNYSMLLGLAENIIPKTDRLISGPAASLLPVKPSTELENQIYDLTFEDGPLLRIKSNIDNWSYRDIVKDVWFAPLVLPSVFRQILMQITCVEHIMNLENAEGWIHDWLHFAGALVDFAYISSEDEDDWDKIEEWIENVVSRFSAQQKMVDRYTSYLNDGGQN